jgi:hypothetical protein
MIGFNHIGRLGQLGNQMFQFASLKGIAMNRGFGFMIPRYEDAVVDSLGNKLRTELFDPFDPFTPIGTVEVDRYIQEPGFEFSESLFNQCPDDVSLVGFFQTEKYFKHIEDTIREDFKFKKEITIECDELIEDAFEEPIALHIRRGDFLINSDNHNNLTIDYYEKALKKFDAKRQVVIFSDDPEWCMKQELFSGDRFIVSSGNGPYHDLYMMTRCDDFIIANSTYSWWGAWLANRGTVVAPSKWFGPNNEHLSTKDLYPSSWEVI